MLRFLLALTTVVCLLTVSRAQDWIPDDEPDEDEQHRPTEPIVGRVTDANGNPIAGATVAGWVNGRPDTRVETTSGTDGGYALVPSRHTDQWRTIVKVPGHRFDLGVGTPPRRYQGRDIVVSPLATISGRISGEPRHEHEWPDSPRPVALIRLDDNGRPSPNTPRVPTLVMVRTERNASFRFRGMAPGRYAVAANVLGEGGSFTITREVSVAAGRTTSGVELSHRQLPELDLQVLVPESARNDDGWVLVRLLPCSFPDLVASRFMQWRSGRAWDHRPISFCLDRDGHRKLRLPAGDYQLMVGSDSRGPAAARTTLVVDPEGTAVVFDVRDWQPVTLRLPATATGDYGVRGVSVAGFGYVPCDRGDGDGPLTCTIDRLAPGTYELSAHRFDRVVATRTITVADVPLDIDWEFDAHPEPGNPGRPAETVTVAGSAGEPVPASRVFAVWRKDSRYPDHTTAGDDGVARFRRLIWEQYEVVVFLADGRILLPDPAHRVPYWRWSPDDGPLRVQGHQTAHGLLVYAFHDLYSGHTHDLVTDDQGCSGLRNFDLLQSIGSHSIIGADFPAAVAWLDSWIASHGRYSKLPLKILRAGEVITREVLAGDIACDFSGYAKFLRPIR